MANAWYNKGLEGFAAGNVDWDANDIRLVCIDHADDTPNVSTDDFLDDLTAPSRVASSGAFGSKTTTDGYLDAADVTLTSVTGDQFESFTIYVHTGTDATARLLIYFDTATGLPLTPDGGNVTVTWQSTSPWIARL
jgi:hypothetical protein